MSDSLVSSSAQPDSAPDADNTVPGAHAQTVVGVGVLLTAVALALGALDIP